MTTRQSWTVGELSALTGLSVRTFHHYDQIELLQPSARTEGGHRRYLPDDIVRLALIMVLRRAGLSLSDIALALDSDPERVDLGDLIEQQAQALRLSLIDTLAFWRKVTQRPIQQVARDPGQLRQLVRWAPRHDITVQPIILLVYADVELAYHRLIEMFGFQPGYISRRANESPGYAEISGPMGNIRLHSPRPGLRPPDPSADPSMMTVVGVADIKAHLDRAGRLGAQIVHPITTRFGFHEYQAFDHEHHLWCFQEPVVRSDQVLP